MTGADTGAAAGTGAGAGAGADAESVFVTGGGAATCCGCGGRESGAVPEEIAPSSSETSLGGAVLPAKNSAAVSAGSAEGAGG